MEEKIFLKDVVENLLFVLDDHIKSEEFIETYHNPNNLIWLIPIYCDGGGFNGEFSFYCFGKKTDFKNYKTSEYLTNNEAEYIACFNALKSAQPHDLIFSDSRLIVNQINGSWKCNPPHLKTYCVECKKLVNSKNISLLWIPRNLNLAGYEIEKLQRSLKRERIINNQ